MSDITKIKALLEQHLHLASSGFSIGALGAIAEFHHSSEEPIIDNPDPLTIMTKRGAIRLEIPENTYPVAYEALSKNKQRWQQGLAFCLPNAEAGMSRRKGLTELSTDKEAIDNSQTEAVLFDMGIDAYHIDFCIRTKEKELIKLLRQFEGVPYEKLSDTLKAEIIKASPCRVVMSKLGRIEIYQAIGQEKTPQGPHTHLLPKLFSKKMTHSANTPIPENLVPCLTLHPGNPLVDHFGQSIPFDLSLYKQFQALLDQWGLAECNEVKKLLSQAVLLGSNVLSFPKPSSREARATLRVTLRQMQQQAQFEPHIAPWCEYFDRYSE